MPCRIRGTVKLIYLCLFLHSETLGEEIRLGLNLVKVGTMHDFAGYGKGKDVTRNRQED